MKLVNQPISDSILKYEFTPESTQQDVDEQSHKQNFRVFSEMRFYFWPKVVSKSCFSSKFLSKINFSTE